MGIGEIVACIMFASSITFVVGIIIGYIVSMKNIVNKLNHMEKVITKMWNGIMKKKLDSIEEFANTLEKYIDHSFFEKVNLFKSLYSTNIPDYIKCRLDIQTSKLIKHLKDHNLIMIKEEIFEITYTMIMLYYYFLSEDENPFIKRSGDYLDFDDNIESTKH